MTIHPRVQPKPATQEFDFSDKDFQQIASLAKARFGLDLQTSKKPLVYSRLSKRLRALGITSFSDYCRHLQETAGESEEGHLLSALTTNVTQFFREPHHFTYIRTQLGNQLADRARRGEQIRVWSAACSSGEEAYCLAATLFTILSETQRQNLRILATDIDPVVIAKAERGTYPADQLQQIPNDLRPAMVEMQADQSQFTIKGGLRRFIRFGRLNLMDPWPMRGKFDLIMCRNAAIYFDKQTQAALWQRFADSLKPDGHLMIGHSERISGPATATLINTGITTYQKQRALAERLGAD